MEKIDTREFDASKTILDLQRILLEKNVNSVIVKLTDIKSPVKLIEVGFIPAQIIDPHGSESLGNVLVSHFVEKLNEDEMEYWYEDRLEEKIRFEEDYIYANIEGWKELGQKYSLSLPLILYASDLVYGSFRPKTDMSIFRQATSVLYQQVRLARSKYIAEILTTKREIVLAIPVTRYAEGMSKGLFHTGGGIGGNYCGTFYYHEPESTTYLVFPGVSSLRVYRNKYTAIRELYKEFNIREHIEQLEEEIDKEMNRIPLDYFLYPERYPDDMRMTPLELESFFTEYYYTKPDKRAKKLPNRKHYVGTYLKLYAREDIFDQDICTAAKENGIDIVIFTHMIGRYQVVTEILDTRDRVISFSNLTYPLG